MTWWPGWDSIGNSAWWSQFWFAISLVGLLAFGASQFVSHIYGLRKAELVALDRSAAQNRLAQAATIEMLRPAPPQHVEDRHLSNRQQRIIVETLRSVPNVRLSFVLLEDHEAADFGEELVSALQNAGVMLTGLSRRNVLLPAPVGVRIWYKEGDPAAASILDAFRRAAIPIVPIVGRLGDQAAHIVVGVKSAPWRQSRFTAASEPAPARQ
jgi:hypothetical protein